MNNIILKHNFKRYNNVNNLIRFNTCSFTNNKILNNLNKFNKPVSKPIHILSFKYLKKVNNPIFKTDDIQTYFYKIPNKLEFDKDGLFLLAEDNSLNKTNLQILRDLSFGKQLFLLTITGSLALALLINFNLQIFMFLILPPMFIFISQNGFVKFKQISFRRIDKIYIMKDMKNVILEMNVLKLWKTVDIRFLSKLEESEYNNYDKISKNNYIRGHFFPVKVGNEICLIPNNIDINNKEIFSAIFNGYYLVNADELDKDSKEFKVSLVSKDNESFIESNKRIEENKGIKTRFYNSLYNVMYNFKKRKTDK